MWFSLLSLALFTTVNAQSYSPARPPAVPLAVRSPYTSAWTSTSGNGTLNSNGVMFWTGAGLGWEGIITVDGVSYEWMGTGSQSLPTLRNLKKATPVSVTYDSQWSNFTFAAGPVDLHANFLSAVLPKDLCRSSIPLSYLDVSHSSRNGSSHDVQLYADVDGSWISYDSGGALNWTLYNGAGQSLNGSSAASNSSLYSWHVSLQTPYEFAEDSDFPEWGNLTWTTSAGSASNFSFESGYSNDVRYDYVFNHYLSDLVDPNLRSYGSRDPVFAFVHDFGTSTSGSALYTIGSVQQPMIRYLNSGGVESLDPWWASPSCYGNNIFDMVSFHYNDYSTSAGLAAQWEAQLKQDVDSYYTAENANVTTVPTTPVTNTSAAYIFDPNTAYGYLDPTTYLYDGVPIPDVSEPEAYYSIVALSTRQVMGSWVLTIPPTSSCSTTAVNNTEPLLFMKEISSDGNVNTVDVMFPALPFLLYANPRLITYLLNPLFQNQEGNFYPNGYSMHDLGSNFPNATGHVEGDDEYMPVEESGNMILMVWAYYKFTGDSAFVTAHAPKLAQWAQYLIEFSLIPNIQLSTDDFAGQLINQTNLAIKGIVALQAMSGIARVAGNETGAVTYATLASEYYDEWEYFAIDPSRRHTLLAYEWRSSWGLLYNVWPDKLLNLGIIPEHLYAMQSGWYPQVSQIFGVPLDNRHSYTKSDWEMWTAAYCSPSTRKLFVNALAFWINETSTSLPLTDLYETIDSGSYPVSPSEVEFIARPVVGGHFVLLAGLLAGQNSLTGTSLESAFQVNGTDFLHGAEINTSAPPSSAPTAISNFTIMSVDPTRMVGKPSSTSVVTLDTVRTVVATSTAA